MGKSDKQFKDDPEFYQILQNFKNFKGGFASKKKALTAEFNDVVIGSLVKPMQNESGKDAASEAMSETAAYGKKATVSYQAAKNRYYKLETRCLGAIKNHSKAKFSDRDMHYEILEYTRSVNECTENYTQFMRCMINLSQSIMQKENKLWGSFVQSFDNFAVLIGTKVSPIDSQEFSKLQSQLSKVSHQLKYLKFLLLLINKLTYRLDND